MGAFVALLVVPAAASAASCTPAQRVDARVAAALVVQLRGSGGAGAADAGAILVRARRTCRQLPVARAIATAYRRGGVPTPGVRRRVLGYDLVGTAVSGGVTWRVDPVLHARRVVAARSPKLAAAARTRLVAASTTTRGATIWSIDPTRPTWNPVLQATVAATLRSGRTADRTLASNSVRAAATTARQRAVQALPIDVALLTAYRFELAGSATSNVAARRVARTISLRTFARVRAASRRGWSQSVPGAWSTLGEHRQLVVRSRALLRLRPNPATARVVERFGAQLAVPPAVTFGGLPAAAFYPWPRDGAFDSEQVQVVVDKPAVVGLTVYGADDTPVRTTEQSVAPGSVQLAWDGAANDGTIVAAGEYRYAVTATDLVGNQQLVAGLGTFTVARDTTPPVAKRGTVTWGVTKDGPRITASWEVEEVHSPRVKTYLALASGTTRTSMLLHETLQKATVRRPTTLARGTWRVSYVFIDGSGNRTNLPAGSFVVR